MKIEKLRKSHKNKIILGGLISLGIIGTITILPSFAKYRLTDSINIANGVVNYKVPDFNIIAMYKSEDGENYTEITDRMPDSEYIINEEKSYCNLNGEKDTDAILKTINKNHVISNLIKGDKCYLYFDKYNPTITISNIITNNKVIEQTDSLPNFSQIATTDEGVFKVADGMYGNYSYYWRGAVTNNYVKFANLCWRIVRINGDGTIRLIYDGKSCHENGTTGETAGASWYSNEAVKDRNEYVGYTYSTGSQRTLNGTASNLKAQTESWYKTNITNEGYDEKVVLGKFCNDRNVASGYSWASQPGNPFNYAALDRSGAKSGASVIPTLSCTNTNDIYSLKVGAITMDEVIMAGSGKWYTVNSSYYLYNGYYYWTMTPWGWNSSIAYVVFVNYNGQLNNRDVSNIGNLRPVINLLSSTEFKSGTDGTLNNPYEVL